MGPHWRRRRANEAARVPNRHVDTERRADTAGLAGRQGAAEPSRQVFAAYREGCMTRIEHIGDATPMNRWKRYRLRKKGHDIPTPPRKRGYTQTTEHIAKRKRCGSDHYGWLGDSVSTKGGRTRALRAFKNIGPCIECGNPKAERHHKDDNTANNDPDNIAVLCRRCHMVADGRLAKFTEMAKCPRK